MTEITASGGNLFQIAAEYMGDALQWISIARTNAISDPMLSGITKLTIPTPSAVFSDGIGPQ